MIKSIRKHPNNKQFIVDALQYNNWSKEIFEQMNSSGVAAVHVTICYHEDFRQTIDNITRWNSLFQKYSDLIVQGCNIEDILSAYESGRTAIIFGFQNCSPIENDINLIEVCHSLGVRFMQLSYNNQSLLASGCYEKNDPGITRMGREVIKEMNRVGLVVDMSHSASKSTLEAIEISERSIAITHANPHDWHPALRNKSNEVLKALSQSGGMLGFSLYPHHLKNKSQCSLEEFCEMVARTADMIGIDSIGFGSDLCQNQPDSVVEWMRNGKWTKSLDFGEGSLTNAGFPDQPTWFKNNEGFGNIISGLKSVGFSEDEVNKISGENWMKFFEKSFSSG
ncbi:MAG: peptidase M19 [Rhodospirillaceae bacterium]|nr:peptidase M19 [Rhodospirillaceae bacterium]|tara:strand:+ start:18767 stop:19777 length:1011 start_codon:yes stop_codon:yes gene_type:complete